MNSSHWRIITKCRFVQKNSGEMFYVLNNFNLNERKINMSPLNLSPLDHSNSIIPYMLLTKYVAATVQLHSVCETHGVTLLLPDPMAALLIGSY